MYHEYPYDAKIPIIMDGKYHTKTFSSDEDVWDVIRLLIAETEQEIAKGSKLNVAESVMAQLPFFACPNIVLSKEAQNDISRFIYAKDFGISPYKGSYGDQPSKWVAKSFLMKSLIEKQQSKAVKDGR